MSTYSTGYNQGPTDLNFGSFSNDPVNGTSAQEQASASAMIAAFFDQAGLGNLGERAWQQWLDGTPADALLQWARTTPEYKTAYPAMDYLKSQGTAWSEGQYQQYEQTVRQSLSAAGIPSDTGFYSSDYIGGFIKGNVSAPEVQKRIDDAAQAAKVDAYSKAAQQLYGVDDGHLTSLFLDPTTTQPLIDKRFGAVQAAGEAANAGYNGGLSTQEAEYLSQFNLSQNQLQQGFGLLAMTPEDAIAGEAQGNAVDKQTQLDLVAGQSYAQQRVKQRQQQLASTTQGSANFTQDKTGSGIGEAQQPI